MSGTPTFFINGRRHHGAYDIDSLSGAVRAAGARVEGLAAGPGDDGFAGAPAHGRAP